jgi:hypothetical protein
MKKILLALTFMIIMTIGLSSNVNDFSSTGWGASNGLDSMPGVVLSCRAIPGGYAIHCYGQTGIFYEISGPNLTIYGNLGPGDMPNVNINKK